MPAIAVRVPGGRTFALEATGGLAALRARVEAAQGEREDGERWELRTRRGRTRVPLPQRARP